jgi:hypothetical protein
MNSAMPREYQTGFIGFLREPPAKDIPDRNNNHGREAADSI